MEPQVVRLLASFLMHLTIHPEVKQAITIMKFLKYTKDVEFLSHRKTTFIVALMKLLSAFYCELVHIFMISQVEDIRDILKDYVALGFIVQIDNMFAKNFESIDGDKIVGEYQGALIIKETENYRDKLLRKLKSLFHWDRSATLNEREEEAVVDRRIEQLCISTVFIVVNELYVTVYFYLIFYQVVVLNYFMYKS